MAAPSRALGPRDCIPWNPRLWDQGIYASAYDEPVKYGFIVIAIVRIYATEIWAVNLPFQHINIY